MQSAANASTSAGIKAGAPGLKNIYRFPSFTEGTVLFRNGVAISKPFNYSISRDEIDFIDDKGDTLSLDDPLTLSYVNINGSRFYYYKEGFVQTICTNHGITLAFKEKLILYPEQAGILYGSPGYTITRKDYAKMHDSAAAYGYFTAAGKKYNLEKENEKLILVPESYFFWGDSFGRFSKTNSAFILNHYPKHQAAISNFIKVNRINFNREADLFKLLDYCDQFK